VFLVNNRAGLRGSQQQFFTIMPIFGKKRENKSILPFRQWAYNLSSPKNCFRNYNTIRTNKNRQKGQ